MREALVLILSAVTIIGVCSVVRAQPFGAVFIDPSTATVPVCTNFDVYVRESLSNVFAFELHILFNPAAVEVIALKEGADILARAPYYFTIQLTYDNLIGRIDAIISLITPEPPLVPIAELVHATFHCKSALNTALDLEVTILVDSDGNVIPPDMYTVQDGFVSQYTTLPVGGEWVSIDAFKLLTPWMSLISTIAVAVSFVFGKRIKKLQN